MTRTILRLGGSPRSGSTTTLALRIALDGASQAGARTSLNALDFLELLYYAHASGLRGKAAFITGMFGVGA